MLTRSAGVSGPFDGLRQSVILAPFSCNVLIFVRSSLNVTQRKAAPYQYDLTGLPCHFG